jgi:hypothetical protein
MIQYITEALRKDGKFWVVVLVVLVVLIGLFYNLVLTKRKVERIKERLDSEK